MRDVKRVVTITEHGENGYTWAITYEEGDDGSIRTIPEGATIQPRVGGYQPKGKGEQ